MKQNSQLYEKKLHVYDFNERTNTFNGMTMNSKNLLDKNSAVVDKAAQRCTISFADTTLIIIIIIFVYLRLSNATDNIRYKKLM